MSSATAPRKQAARLPRPAARYRKGQAPKGFGEAASDSDEDDEEQQDGELGAGDVLIQDVEEEEEDEGGLEVRREVVGRLPGKGMNVALRDVNISKEGRVVVAGKAEVGKTEVEIEEEEEEEEDDEDAEGEEEEETSSEEESSEEEAPKVQFRPVFVPKRARVTIAEKEAASETTEEALKRKELEAEERKKQSHDMVADSIRRELAEKEKEAEVPDVDDTDGLDPSAEFDAWRLRELARIKRDTEAALQRELEREEIERRRALPEEQRLKEDMERAEKTRADKPKGQQKFLQKYWHKGAFHQDEEILTRHDFTEATESTTDVSLLPKVMQVKNFGKRGRTKYTHLLDQDTTAAAGGFGGTAPVKPGGLSTAGGGCFLCGGPHLKKDCPQNRDMPPNRIGTGANSAPTGVRRWGAGSDRPREGERDRDRDRDSGRSSWRDRDRDGDDARRGARDEERRDGDRYDRDRGRGTYKERERDERERRWDRETQRRSHSPRRERRRERSVEGERGEKRRRLD